LTKLVKYTLQNSFSKKNLTKLPPSYPNEMMVKLFSSPYYTNLIKKKFFDKEKFKILEVGSSSGNNLRYFIDRKFHTHGLEINKDMVDLGIKNLKRMKYNIPEIKVGHNTGIPYQDGFFNCLVSINCLHYSGGEIDKALKEYKRVLKKGSLVYIETSGPKHFSRKTSKRLGALRWIRKTKYKDFRNNSHIFGYFSNKKQFQNILEKNFSKVEVYERYELSKLNLNFFVGVCIV
jgi:ubiquinone/menaquinone biosynthesis C-methylase UbiE